MLNEMLFPFIKEFKVKKVLEESSYKETKVLSCIVPKVSSYKVPEVVTH
jgi:hypothetical protein